MDGPRVSASTASLSLLAPGSAPASIFPSEVQNEDSAIERCTICNSTINLPRLDGTIEKASTLPCSHIFGHICIKRWLEIDSVNQDCPICRRSMLYRTCGHIIRACEVEKAPKAIQEDEMPENCLRCRGGLSEQLREINKMREAQEQALEGLRHYLPGLFGSSCKNMTQSVDGRIEELRKEWGREVDAAAGQLEEKEGRLEW